MKSIYYLYYFSFLKKSVVIKANIHMIRTKGRFLDRILFHNKIRRCYSLKSLWWMEFCSLDPIHCLTYFLTNLLIFLTIFLKKKSFYSIFCLFCSNFHSPTTTNKMAVMSNWNVYCSVSEHCSLSTYTLDLSLNFPTLCIWADKLKHYFS